MLTVDRMARTSCALGLGGVALFGIAMLNILGDLGVLGVYASLWCLAPFAVLMGIEVLRRYRSDLTRQHRLLAWSGITAGALLMSVPLYHWFLK